MGTVVIAGGTGLLGTALLGGVPPRRPPVVVLTRHPTREHEVALVARTERLVVGPDAEWRDGRHQSRRHVDRRRTLDRRAQGGHSRESHAGHGALVRAIAAARATTSCRSSAVRQLASTESRGDEPATEATPPGSDFLADVCRDWEAIASQAANRSRVVLLRSGVVLAREGGALPQLALPFKLFAGGPAGTGRQFVSWIHVHDWVAMVKWALATTTIAGRTQRDRAGARHE